MSSLNNGLLIEPESRPPFFDSRKETLIIPGGLEPPYLGVVTIVAGPLSVPAGGTATATVLTLNHGLGYAPFIDTYFYPTSAQPTNPDQYFQITDSYTKNFFSYIGTGAIEDILTVKVDDIRLTVTHTYFNPSAGTSSPFPVNMKYTIFANPGYLQP